MVRSASQDRLLSTGIGEVNIQAAPDSSPIFKPLPTTDGGFACVACDFPAHFSTWSPKGQGRSPSKHYETLPMAMLATLPLESVLARDAWLFLWVPHVHAPELPHLMRALGFAFSAKAFTWIKTLPSLARGPRPISTDNIESVLPMGGGHTTRKNSESCWLGRRGKPRILSHGVREVIVAPRREHSRKPDEVFRRVETFCPGPRLELFGRESRAGWTVWGNEATRFDQTPAPLLNRELAL
jgi:N6-adenosine-specific RNA methylase IME4